MLVGEDTVEIRGDRVSVSRDGLIVAFGRWRGGRVIERSGFGADGDGDERWAAIEAAVARESEDFLAQATVAAYDARGVDVTQIDRMLALTPRQRLHLLEVQRRSLSRLLPDESTD